MEQLQCWEMSEWWRCRRRIGVDLRRMGIGFRWLRRLLLVRWWFMRLVCGISDPFFFLRVFFKGRDMLRLGGVGEAGILMLMLMMVKFRCSGNCRHFCCKSNAGFGIMAAIFTPPSDSKVSVRLLVDTGDIPFLYTRQGNELLTLFPLSSNNTPRSRAAV